MTNIFSWSFTKLYLRLYVYRAKESAALNFNGLKNISNCLFFPHYKTRNVPTFFGNVVLDFKTLITRDIMILKMLLLTTSSVYIDRECNLYCCMKRIQAQRGTESGKLSFNNNRGENLQRKSQRMCREQRATKPESHIVHWGKSGRWNGMQVRQSGDWQRLRKGARQRRKWAEANANH